MKPNAIIYKSNTDYTKQYAELLGKKTELPVYSLEEAMQRKVSDRSVIFLGWLMAGKVQGYKKAAKRYNIAAVCGVGMGATGSQLQDVQKANILPPSMPVFTLQGGFDMKRLHGVYKLMMTVMKNTVGKSLARKPDRTPDEDTMLDLLENGGSRVSVENLTSLLDWYFSLPVSES